MIIGSVTYLDDYFGQCVPINGADALDEIKPDLLVFWGGEDVHPEYYREPDAYCGGVNSARDSREMRIISAATARSIPILGICRGAQLLCVASGGKLWQHVDNHAYGSRESHKIITRDGKVLKTNSAHHQMMRPDDSAEVLATSHVVRSPLKYDGWGKHETSEPEVEACYFPLLRAVGIQGHPEWLSKTSDLTQYTYQVVKEYLNVDLSKV